MTIAKPAATAPLKLDLACGQMPRDGFEGVDVWSGARHVVDLLTFPWHWRDSSVDELNCSHFIEHIPTERTPAGQDMFFAFFDECWRILKPGALFFVQCPNARSNRAFQDPTHRRFIVAETFLYLSAEWRKSSGLTHYDVKCDFKIDVEAIISSELSKLESTTLTARMGSEWNVIQDWHATLRTIKT